VRLRGFRKSKVSHIRQTFLWLCSSQRTSSPKQKDKDWSFKRRKPAGTIFNWKQWNWSQCTYLQGSVAMEYILHAHINWQAQNLPTIHTKVIDSFIRPCSQLNTFKPGTNCATVDHYQCSPDAVTVTPVSFKNRWSTIQLMAPDYWTWSSLLCMAHVWSCRFDGKPDAIWETNKTALPNICKRKQCTHNIHTHHISVAAYKVTTVRWTCSSHSQAFSPQQPDCNGFSTRISAVCFIATNTKQIYPTKGAKTTANYLENPQGLGFRV